MTAEEVEDASLNVPRAMWWSYLMNVFMGLVMLSKFQELIVPNPDAHRRWEICIAQGLIYFSVTMLFCMGDLRAAVKSDAPYLVLFKNTDSNAVTFVLLIILLLLVFSGNITALATTSRELWAFSRDKGFPFSRWISRVCSNNLIVSIKLLKSLFPR